MKSNSTTQERYLDAAVGVFMEQYAKLLGDSIKQDMIQALNEPVPFPEGLDARCQKLLQNHLKLQRQAARKKLLRRCLGAVAILLLVLIGSFSILFSTVDAVRVAVLDFIIEKTDSYWIFTEDKNAISTQEFDETNPLGCILPNDFTMTFHQGNLGISYICAEYRNSENQSLFFSMEPSGATILLDAEDAHILEFILNGHNAFLITEDSGIRLLWLDDNKELFFTLITNNLPEEDILSYGEQITAMFDQ